MTENDIVRGEGVRAYYTRCVFDPSRCRRSPLSISMRSIIDEECLMVCAL